MNTRHSLLCLAFFSMVPKNGIKPVRSSKTSKNYKNNFITFRTYLIWTNVWDKFILQINLLSAKKLFGIGNKMNGARFFFLHFDKNWESSTFHFCLGKQPNKWFSGGKKSKSITEMFLTNTILTNTKIHNKRRCK